MPPVPSTPLVLETFTGPELKERPEASTDNLPDHWFELTWNGHVLKYTLDILTVDNQPLPPDGYPLYIGLHGGGATSTQENNLAWLYVQDHYSGWYPPSIQIFQRDQASKPNAKPQAAVLVCPRGIGDTWDLHWRPEACVLMEHMITNLIRKNPPEVKILQQSDKYKNTPGLIPAGDHFVDSKKVVLWGFSAGGDGAFRLGPWMADRFAAVVPAAGHPGDKSFADNTANVKMCLEVGEDDYYAIGDATTFEWSRPKVYAEVADQALLDARDRLPEAERSSHYIHECFVVRNEYRADGGTRFGIGESYKHQYWSWSQFLDTDQYVVPRTSFADWTTKMKAIEDKAIANRNAGIPDLPVIDQSLNTYQKQNISPLRWCLAQDATRVAFPNLIIWNLRFRPGAPDVVPPVGWQRRFFYWLYLRILDAPDVDKPDYKPEEVRWTTNADGAYRFMIRRPNEYMGILLPRFVLEKEVIVAVGEPGQERRIWRGKVEPVPAILEDTRLARRDEQFHCAAMIYLQSDHSNNGWTVKQETSLRSPKGAS